MRIRNLALLSLAIFALMACDSGDSVANEGIGNDDASSNATSVANKDGGKVASGAAPGASPSSGSGVAKSVTKGSGSIPKAGEYSTTMKLIAFEIPGMPAGTMDQMQSAMPQGKTSCLTDADIQKGSWANVTDELVNGAEEGSACETLRDNNTATSLDTEVKCKPPGGGEVTIAMTGTTQADGLQAKMTTSGKDAKGAAMKMVVEIDSKRVGDCKK